ncbi:MAG: SirB2 family protein [Proteobacteria bacterium]|nr:SirB2 family protein [Pseudomonadota bacterium]
MYSTLKFIHVCVALLTISGFLLRGYWMMTASTKLQQRWVRVLPHVLDTVFLLAGIGLIMTLHLQVMHSGWLLMKIAALIVYIVLGTIALKRGATRKIRVSAFILAILTFAYITGVALSKSMLSWLSF